MPGVQDDGGFEGTSSRSRNGSLGFVNAESASNASKRKLKPRLTSRSTMLLGNNIFRKNSIFTKIYLHPWFETGTLCVICMNSVWMGIDVDWNPANRPDSMIPAGVFDAGDSLFCVFFSCELTIRILAYRRKRDFFLIPRFRRWNIFDLILVTLMVLETWILPHIFGVGANQLSTLSILRMLRLLRITHIFRLVPELGMLVTSMMGAVRSCASTCVLAVGIMYIFAILFTQWVKGKTDTCIKVGDGGDPIDGVCTAADKEADACLCLEDYFGSMSASFVSLMQILVFDDTFEVVRPMLQSSFFYGGLVLIYILLVSFTVMNMLIGIICDIISDISARERGKLQRLAVVDFFQQLDTNQDGTISEKEFEDCGGNDILQELGVETRLNRTTFRVLDVNGDGVFDLDEFVEMIFRCNTPPESKDILHIMALVDKISDSGGVDWHLDNASEKPITDVSRGSLANSVMESNAVSMSRRSTSSLSLSKNPKQGWPWMRVHEERRDRDAEVQSRLDSMGKRLEDLRMSAGVRLHSGSQAEPSEGGGLATSPSSLHRSTEQHRLLGPLRKLGPQLRALRAEYKAAEAQRVGQPECFGGGPENEGLQPLEELLCDVIDQVANVRQALEGPGAGGPTSEMTEGTQSPTPAESSVLMEEAGVMPNADGVGVYPEAGPVSSPQVHIMMSPSAAGLQTSGRKDSYNDPREVPMPTRLRRNRSGSPGGSPDK